MTTTEYNRRFNILRLAYVNGDIDFAAFDAAVLLLNIEAGLVG